MAAGFSSIRRFNAMFQTLYQRPPRELQPSQLADAEQPGAEGITLKLPYAPPYDWDAMIDFLGARAIRGIEAVDGRRCYRRSIALDGAQGVMCVEPARRKDLGHGQPPSPGRRGSCATSFASNIVAAA